LGSVGIGAEARIRQSSAIDNPISNGHSFTFSAQAEKMNMSEDEALARHALEAFNSGLAARDGTVAAEFAADAIFVGSEPGESARGTEEVRALLEGIGRSPNDVVFEWVKVEAQGAGGLVWFFADGHVVISGPGGTVRRPYGLSGVLERRGSDYSWRLFHGSEPWIAPPA